VNNVCIGSCLTILSSEGPQLRRYFVLRNE
jgi:hypothetical protein